MEQQYFTPWVGPQYTSTKTLLISESTYDWFDEDGDQCTPPPSHPEESIRWHIQHFGKRGYYTAINKVICGKEKPSVSEMQAAWDGLAYTPFVQGTVGLGARTRPSTEQWRIAKSLFRPLLERLRPARVIITGFEMWNDWMPETDVQLTRDLQAYELHDGGLVWCLAVPHPSNTTVGFRWQNISQYVETFRSITLPAKAGA